MIIVLFAASMISSLLYSLVHFKKELEVLETSYKSTLTFSKNNIESMSPIKESLVQMKTLSFLFLKMLLILSPFILIACFVEFNNSDWKSVFINLNNNIVIVLAFLLTSFILKNAKK